ncbi:xanthine dehydrogenase accessory protein XdhC [Enterovibrio norvegicus]|uniref:xanthine dehydrogenase accessory protein XdhC n=1 Tax=Enterovibrio norvegicus TaxID=188144 RepID=UPI000C841EC9|nr:xanthine dehydrogenase accessory protein XdhC [Enterovibrio norvegicus]MCC4798569.1 xanthine dehydrogenase accessory protein XdhC [Enterovibrio norvegicus]PMH67756.1 xanthine dehydrogenase accessory protein XdhC [Enterovibrio norvegicus]PMI28710.1 xanthine dehydrogenase accessory protein XdhC [Enterovibrio norvegicus]PMI36997.1 xanthine dehydrogenase accessory protein XdhC [Enterovibrio norvegicus]PMN49507.1 xanthine dehydrogenase accessory protein XdhC [Enterovibrio norvegicus]
MFKDNWIQALAQFETQGIPCVMVTVLEDKGSVPRGAGTKMLVTEEDVIATIGGGHLEHIAMKTAREMLINADTDMKVEQFNLGARLGQCCGGMVTLSFEPIGQPRHVLAVFGAGHVAKALIPILATLPFKVYWIDEREAQFPDHLPRNVEKWVTDDPVGEVASLPENAMYLVLTHNHQLDFDLARAILKRGDSRYFGMIGSLSKRKRFDYRLLERGFSQEAVNTMICPIGIASVKGKHPAEIAVSVAGELIACYQGETIGSKRPTTSTNNDSKENDVTRPAIEPLKLKA